jgi:hypothetical protein
LSYFDLDPRADADAMTWAQQNPSAGLTPSFFDQSATALPRGLWSGIVAKPALLIGDAADVALKPIAKGIDEMFGGTTATDFLNDDRQKRINMVKETMPDARMGLAGQVLFGAGDVLPAAIAGTVMGGPAGGAAAVGTTQGYADAVMGLEKDKLDPTTAMGRGAITGLTQAAGVFLPASIGGSVLKSIGAGVAGNVGLGVAQRAATGELLEQRGYGELAQQYKAFDGEAMAVDAVLGTAFGVLGAKTHRAPVDIPQPVIDSALAANAVQHVDTGVAPGVPADPASRAAHTKAINKAANDLAADRAVDISATGIENASFVPVRSEQRAAVMAAVEDLNPLRKVLDEVDTLRAEVESLGLEAADDQIFTGRQIDAPAVGNGRRAELFVGDRPEPVRFDVVEADTLAPQIGKAENQFRDRTRAASDIQINSIANNLQFGRLGDAPTMAEGAPTLANDGRIVGGNGRVAAVRQAYEKGSAADYRAQLEARAAEYGIDPATVQGMQKPVLVRRFENPVDVRNAAILSNEGGGLRMSALEQAKVDAERMPALENLQVPENGDLGAASARDFMRRWLANMPLDQQAGLVGADGKVSAEGLQRARNAILYHAYGDSPTLARLVESADETQKNVAAALVRAAANAADVRQGIEVGDFYDRDIRPQLLQAVEKFADIRAQGMSVDEFVNQGDMFGNSIGGEAVALMRFMEGNKRSSKALSDLINGYYNAVRALGNPKQADIFAADPPSRAAILSSLLDKNNSKGQVSLFDDAGPAPAEKGLYGGKIPEAKDLPPEQRAIEARFADWILADVDRAIGAYAALPDSDGGKILNTDIARDLSPEYNASKDARSMLSAAVHEPASWLVKEMYRRKLAEKPKDGERAMVAFTAGGTGSGKSSAIARVPAAQAAIKSAQIVYDTNMNTYSSAAGRIRQALEAGKTVDFLYVARDPVVALTEGSLPRAMRQGRTAPLTEHAKTHIGAAEVAPRLIKEFGENPNFRWNIIDNTGPNGSQRVADIAILKQIDYNDLEARLKAALESEFKNGRITETVYRGTAGGDGAKGRVGSAKEPAGGSGERAGRRTVQQELQGARPDNGRADGGESAQEQLGASENTVSQILESAPNAKLVDDAGDIRTAVPALAEADATIAKAEKDAAGYDAAVACFLRG